jgi:hypothetical protein
MKAQNRYSRNNEWKTVIRVKAKEILFAVFLPYILVGYLLLCIAYTPIEYVKLKLATVNEV